MKNSENFTCLPFKKRDSPKIENNCFEIVKLNLHQQGLNEHKNEKEAPENGASRYLCGSFSPHQRAHITDLVNHLITDWF